jgi:hypothetical protein
MPESSHDGRSRTTVRHRAAMLKVHQLFAQTEPSARVVNRQMASGGVKRHRCFWAAWWRQLGSMASQMISPARLEGAMRTALAASSLADTVRPTDR